MWSTVRGCWHWPAAPIWRWHGCDLPRRGGCGSLPPEATGTLLLGRILAEFRALYPEVVLELTLSDDQLDLVGEGYDLALRAAPLKDSSLICRRIGQVARHLVAAPAYLAAHGIPQQLSELGRYACLVHSAMPVWPLQEGGWRPQGACVSNSLLALREMALHDGGDCPVAPPCL